MFPNVTYFTEEYKTQQYILEPKHSKQSPKKTGLLIGTLCFLQFFLPFPEKQKYKQLEIWRTKSRVIFKVDFCCHTT